MRERTGRGAAAAALSLALHGALLAPVVAGSAIHWPRSPLPIELLGPPPRASRTPPRTDEKRAPEKPRPKAPKREGAGGAPARATPRKRAEPTPPAPLPIPEPADLRPFVPGGTTIALLVRTDRLRGSLHRRGVEALLDTLPDYHALLAGTGFTPMDDLDALLIATPNPFDTMATYLAARHHPDPKLEAAFGHRVWRAGDGRTLRHPDPTLTVLARPDAPPPASPDGGAPVNPAEDRLPDELLHFERAADPTRPDDPGAAVLVTIDGLDSLVRLGAGVPTPRALAVAATAEVSPAVRARFAFADEAAAARFAEEWPRMLRRFHDNTVFLGIGALFDGLKIERRGPVVELAGRLPRGETVTALDLAAAVLPHPPPVGPALAPVPPAPLPAPLPQRAPTAPPPLPDAGVPRDAR